MARVCGFVVEDLLKIYSASHSVSADSSYPLSVKLRASGLRSFKGRYYDDTNTVRVSKNDRPRLCQIPQSQLNILIYIAIRFQRCARFPYPRGYQWKRANLPLRWLRWRLEEQSVERSLPCPLPTRQNRILCCYMQLDRPA
jgi:hypothetical protein